MKLISRYLMTTIISTILLILLILMGIELLISFIGQLSDIGTGNYTLWEAIKFVCLDMPYQLYNFFPMAGLVGSLLGLGALANQSELIVIRAAGFSTGQITLAVLKAAFFMVIIAMILGEVIAPQAEKLANTNKAMAKSGNQTLTTRSGLWIREQNQFIHVQTMRDKKHMQNVTSYKFNDKHQMVMAMHAKRADFINGQWILHGVKQSKITPALITSKLIPELTWNIRLNPDVLNISDTEPRNMSLPKLYTYIHYLKSNDLRASNYELDFYKRIAEPLATAVMIFLAVPFVFGSLRTVPMGVRVLTGVVVGFTFYILNQFFGPLSLLYQLPPVLGAFLPTIVFVLLGFVLLFRVAK